MTLDLTDDEKLALVAHLRRLLEHDPVPFALRFDPLKAILAKLETTGAPARTVAADQSRDDATSLGWHPGSGGVEVQRPADDAR